MGPEHRGGTGQDTSAILHHPFVFPYFLSCSLYLCPHLFTPPTRAAHRTTDTVKAALLPFLLLFPLVFGRSGGLEPVTLLGTEEGEDSPHSHALSPHHSVVSSPFGGPLTAGPIDKGGSPLRRGSIGYRIVPYLERRMQTTPDAESARTVANGRKHAPQPFAPASRRALIAVPERVAARLEDLALLPAAARSLSTSTEEKEEEGMNSGNEVVFPVVARSSSTLTDGKEEGGRIRAVGFFNI
ncbi:hypothetical protein PRIPAC_92912 [Pristionchus pacificus]|uniref:Uncharacterized protein n=1 Tax=Pristionchus pacificus TaxID=54126 RepID=A0A2A6CHG7_PRIPA|nr:hypothetical protein PRIPAC_92912 [Pristionchus pacificus]|eukprot:PDM77674.1 hypothetical protein PRIPAC_34541 [Pristionchus pacificus]